jgi:5'-methylthioinosine phosphorylase
MSEIAIIGGTGIESLRGLKVTRREVVQTPFGELSGPVTYGEIGGREILFLARHGYGHRIPPHKVNYRANLWALHSVGVLRVIAINAVGGITPEMRPERLVIPNEIIDYTYGRPHTFFEDDLNEVVHVDFTEPYSSSLRRTLIEAAREAGVDVASSGVYGATQGPRLESAAEIRRLEHDGCDIVGMTGMPEAALARELALEYASIAVVANWAAGKHEGPITMEEIADRLKQGMAKVKTLLEQVLPRIS